MSRREQFFDVLTSSGRGKAIREGRAQIGGHPNDFMFPRSEEISPIRSMDHWLASAPSSEIEHVDVDETDYDRPSNAAISVQHKIGAGRYDQPLTTVHDPSVLDALGEIAHHEPHVLDRNRFYRHAAHGTTPEAADQIAERLSQGRSGVLLSRYGAAGPGVYVFPGKPGHNEAESSFYNAGAVVHGYSSQHRMLYKDDHFRVPEQVRRFADAAVMRSARNQDMGPRAGENTREALVGHGYDSVYDGDSGFTLLHPEQFHVTHIQYGDGRRMEFDKDRPQRMDPNESIWSPRTVGR